jgi:hypothetical protein
MDDHEDPSAFDGHLSACSECREFAEVSGDLADRYRRQVRRGIDRLQRSRPAFPPAPSLVRRLLPLAAAVLILLSLPILPPSGGSPTPVGTASGRVPLFDAVLPDPVDVRVLAWSGETPLPRRLDQDLPGVGSGDPDPVVTLPASLRF